MAELLSGDQAVRIALAVLSALRASGVLPVEFEGAVIASEGTVVYDLNGSRFIAGSHLRMALSSLPTPTSQ